MARSLGSAMKKFASILRSLSHRFVGVGTRIEAFRAIRPPYWRRQASHRYCSGAWSHAWPPQTAAKTIGVRGVQVNRGPVDELLIPRGDLDTNSAHQNRVTSSRRPNMKMSLGWNSHGERSGFRVKCRHVKIRSRNTRGSLGLGHIVLREYHSRNCAPPRRVSLRNFIAYRRVASARPLRVDTICRLTLFVLPGVGIGPGSSFSTSTSGVSPVRSDPFHVERITSAPGRCRRTESRTDAVTIGTTGP